jgi:hypothetical protein
MTRCLSICFTVLALAPGCDAEPTPGDDPPAATTGAGDSGMPQAGEASDDSEPEDEDAESGSEDSGESGEVDGGGSESGETGCGISHAADIQPIWEAHCTAACHEPGGTWMSLMLTDAYAYVSLVDRDGTQTSLYEEYKLVIPGDVENSYLVHKLRDLQGESVGSLGGVAMPAVLVEGGFEAGASLPEVDIQLVEDWIDCGAPE